MSKPIYRRAIVALYVLILAALQTWWCARAQPLHADLAYFESVYLDLIQRHRYVGAFIFTEGFFLFPDFLVYAVLRSLAPGVVGGLIAYAFVFTTAYFAALYALFARIWGPRRSRWTFCLGLLGVVVLGSTTTNFVNTAYWPNHHGALQLLFLLYLWRASAAGGMSTATRRRWLVIDFVLAFLFSFSDLLSIPTVFVPATVFALLDKDARATARPWAFAVVTGAGCVLGYATEYVLVHAGYLIALPFSVTPDEYARVFASFTEFPRSLPNLLGNNRVLFAGVTLVAILYRFVGRRPPSPTWQRNFLGLAAGSLVFTAFTVMITGRWPATSGFDRYYQQFYYLPLVWMVLWGLPALRWPRFVVPAAVVLGSASLVPTIARTTYPVGLTAYPPLVACLDEHVTDLPSPWGLANFYDAKLVTFLSRRQLHLNQVKPNLSAYPWMISGKWFTEDVYGRAIPAHFYYVARNAKLVSTAVAKWGAPARQFACADVTVLIYPDGINPGNWDSSPND